MAQHAHEKVLNIIIHQERQIKTAVRHDVFIRWLKTAEQNKTKTDSTKCWQGQVGALIHC